MGLELAIETVGLTKRYGPIIAVNNLNLEVERNAIHGFLGPNGAGKTTTIKILVGLLRADEGLVRVLGQEVHGDMPETRMRMGYMPELPKFPKHLKGWELLDLYARMYGMTEQQRKEQISRLLEMVGLKGRERDLIGKYSKGMQQRLGIAQAMIGDPELVILDEPSLGLDPVGMVEVRELVKNMAKEGRTIFLSSHLLFEVEQVCTHVTIIHKGVALASSTLQNIVGNLSGHPILEVELAKPSEEVVESLKNLPFISSVEKDGNMLTIKLKTRDDVRSEVSQQITKAGGVIVSMSLKGQTLEEYFMQLIAERGQRG
ncbi:MAG: ABC transporter ATP-binding protein [Nitrososphaerota archaeon]|nr:ABC transporter ATP-binding protein [Candidatus Bathyarchaeota archaeon]MDW8049395.1 ABC transporter ATP-binding protein [Nitrososphaerota archaeon]